MPRSRVDVAAIEKAAADKAKAEAMVKQMEMDMKHREEMLAMQLRATEQMQEQRLKQLEADRRENKDINEKLMLRLAEKEEANKAAQQSQLEMFQTTMLENQKMMNELIKLAQTDEDLATEKTLEWQAKVEALEKEREDWAAAEKAKTEELMRESPPPYALMREPPKNQPLFTEEYPCFAVMGKAGTGKSSFINAIAKLCGKSGPPPCRVSAVGETTWGEPPPVFIVLPNRVNAAFFDRPGVGAAHGGGPKYIRDQGLKWWTGVIVYVDSRVGTEDALLYHLCNEIKTPVLVVRNKMEVDFKKEVEVVELEGKTIDESTFKAQCREYMKDPKIGIEEALLIDTEFPEKHDFQQVMHWFERHSRKTGKAGK